ncbi:MAG: response regulator [Patescibacteria group bacterium]
MENNKKKILLIEDNKEERDFYSDFLSHDFEMETAEDGENGLEKLKAENDDLVLLDIMMPKLDGVGFLKLKNADAKIAGVPVVALTNLGQDEVLKACFEQGIKSYILKAETTPDKVLSVIKQIVGSANTPQ